MTDKVDIRLDKLVLRNYKGFYTGEDEEGVEIKFNQHLTVLIGENGAGKSAVLDAIALFLVKLRSEIANVGDTASIYPFPLPSDAKKNEAVNNKVEETSIDAFFELFPKEIIDYKYGKITETIYVPQLDSSGNEIFDKKGNLKEVEQKIIKPFEKEIKREAKIGFSMYLQKDKSPSEVSVNTWKDHTNKDRNNFDVSVNDKRTLEVFLRDNIHDPYTNRAFRKDSGEDKSVPVLVYYGANSINTNTFGKLEEVETSVFDTYRDALDASKFSFKQFFVWFDDQQKRAAQSLLENKEVNDNSRVKSIADAISIMLDEIIIEEKQTDLNTDDNEVTSEENKTKKITSYKNLRINWFVTPNEMLISKYHGVTKETEDLTVSQLSSGERTLIALVADLTRRLCLANPNSENPLDGNGIVLIDEIDVHLHPKWQRKVVAKLREIFPNVQFVVTTHSPLVLSYAPDTENKVYKLENNGVRELTSYKGMRLLELFNNFYDTPARPQDIQEEIDELLDMIDQEDVDGAKEKLKKLETFLSKDDPAIIEAETSLKYI